MKDFSKKNKAIGEAMKKVVCEAVDQWIKKDLFHEDFDFTHVTMNNDGRIEFHEGTPELVKDSFDEDTWEDGHDIQCSLTLICPNWETEEDEEMNYDVKKLIAEVKGDF